MAEQFKHLNLVLVRSGRARLNGRSYRDPKTDINEHNRTNHRAKLEAELRAANQFRIGHRMDRRTQGLPPLPDEAPLLVHIDPNADPDTLRTGWGLQVISADEDGIVVAATDELSLAKGLETLEKFGSAARGGKGAASVYSITSSGSEDLAQRVISDDLAREWPELEARLNITVDISVHCLPTIPFPEQPEQDDDEEKAHFEKRLAKWKDRCENYYQEWDRVRLDRESQLEEFLRAYNGSILDNFDCSVSNTAVADAFTIRATIPGRAVKDIALNFPHVFEITLADIIELGTPSATSGTSDTSELLPPPPDAPRVCVIDSGIEEQHPFLRSSIESELSHSYVPFVTSVSDEVLGGGHGTRVAGAILFDPPPAPGTASPFFLRNARVLDANNNLDSRLLPPRLIRDIVDRFTVQPANKSRIYNHSISSSTNFRRRHMSAWATSIDAVSAQHDVLFIQAAGNLRAAAVLNHVSSGVDYPGYLLLRSSNISNPAQSLHALTVGSVSFGVSPTAHVHSQPKPEQPSMFSRSGPGLWGATKPDVVEYGGDLTLDANSPPLSTPLHAASAPPLVRNTLGGGPLWARDHSGTSYATPRVTRLAATLQSQFPDDTMQMVRALITQSARWPDWTMAHPTPSDVFSQIGFGVPNAERATRNSASRVTLKTTGSPRIKGRDCHVYRILVPDELRNPSVSSRVLLEVTLAYSARPRRTRLTTKGYLSTWLNWKASNRGESEQAFLARCLLNENARSDSSREPGFDWVLGEQRNQGVRGLRRSSGSLQKDWTIAKGYELPSSFCIAVVGHVGWDLEPNADALYGLCVSLESVDQDINVYQPVHIAQQVSVPVLSGVSS